MALERQKVPENRKWDLSDIFASVAEWESSYDRIDSAIDFSRYEGKLGDADTLLECMTKLNATVKELSLLAAYAHLLFDMDTRNADAMALMSRVDVLDMKLSSATAFMTPELTALPEKTLRGFIADERFREFDYSLSLILKRKPHVLSKETEEVLSLGGRVLGSFYNIFSMMDNADFPAPTVKVNGKKEKLTHGLYGVLLHSPDRNLRRNAFRAYYKAYIDRINTLTATYVGNVDKNVFIAKARKYNGCLEMALANEDVDKKVYENLISCVHAGLPLLHRYYRDRKKLAGLSTQHMYDVYAPIVADAEIKVDYEEAFRMVKEGLRPLGEEYAALLDKAYSSRWIDVEETEGKRNGAYSMSVYGIKHPFVLLNYQKTTSDVFTIAHELGHAMHSYFSDKNQPHEKAEYKIFVAEVASTVNEILLLRHLLRTTDDVALKKYLLSYYMDTLKGTLFRQTQFAEFEYIAHEKAENGEPLTKDVMNGVYLALNKKYYGRSVVSDPEIAYEWARIPHFYRSFYVYKYATGIISAISIVDRIEKEGEPAVRDYFKFLSSGGSDSPVALLRLAGVDLMKKDAFRAGMASFKEALLEFEALN